MNAREFIWSDVNGPGMEHLSLAPTDDGYLADGLYLGRGEDMPPCRLHYVIDIDPTWEMRAATIRLLSGPQAPTELSLSVDDDCAWRDASGTPLANLAGCREIDLFCSPFTNSLAIRRLGLAPGESAEISIAYLDLTDMRLRPLRQRYGCIEPFGPDGGRYRYEALFRSHTAELSVDPDGIVIDFPGSFKRVWDS
jgi:hypothetical protein